MACFITFCMLFHLSLTFSDRRFPLREHDFTFFRVMCMKEIKEFVLDILILACINKIFLDVWLK